MPVTPASVVTRNAGLMSTRLNNEIYLLNPVRDKYTGLDDIGLRVWDLLEGKMRADSLCDRVAKEYRGDPLQIRTELMEFLNELDSEGLLEVQ
ncbi:MAG TPA: PqqD family protein [Bryobacteraceae bacterium]|nr:PqqD family protein [Bryobacteraceae bacterium]